jgi:ATP dependent DNA ligase domain
MPPVGDEWLHEVKLDGFRVQLHKHSRVATVYSKNGADFTGRFPAIAAAVLALPVSSCIIDGELVAPGASGESDFRALLHGRTRGACVYAFDLLTWRDLDIREHPLVQRRAQLEAVLKRGNTGSRLIRFSESFSDADALLAECAGRGLDRSDFVVVMTASLALDKATVSLPGIPSVSASSRRRPRLGRPCRRGSGRVCGRAGRATSSNGLAKCPKGEWRFRQP